MSESKKTILVVDDDRDLCDSLWDLLHERGLRKRQHVDFAPDERDGMYAEILAELEHLLGVSAAPGAR